jgi:hypothetical protein
MSGLWARAVRAGAVCLATLGVGAVTSGQVQVGTNVVVALTTNQTLFAPGDLFELGRTLDLVRPSAQAQGDLYVRLEDPAGRVMYLGGDPDRFVESAAAGGGTVFSAASPAFRSSPWPLDTVRGLSGRLSIRRTILAGLVPEGLGPGTYTFEATLLRPGGDPRDPSAVITTSVPINVSVGAPTRVGHAAIRVTSKVVGVASNPRTNTVAVARNPGILSLLNLATERVVFSTALLDPGDVTLSQGLDWAGSQAAVAVNSRTNVAVVTNAQPIYAGLPSFLPSVWLVDLSSGSVIERLALDPSPAIADPTRFSPGRCYFAFTAFNRTLSVRPLAINSRTNTAVVSSVTRVQPERTTLYVIDLARGTITARLAVEPRINSIAIDEIRNRLVGIRREDLYVLDLADLSSRVVPFPAGLERFCGASRTLAILPDTGEVVVTGATLQADNSTLGAVTAIDVDRGRAPAPIEVPRDLLRTVGAQDPVLVTDTRKVVVNATAAGLSLLALVDLDQRRVDESAVFKTSISLPTAALSPKGDALLLAGDADNLLILRPGGTPTDRPVGGLRVRVRDAGTDAALAGATVVVEGVGLAVVTSQTFPADFAAVPPGPQSVTVSASGFDPQTVSVTIEPGGTREVTVSLRPGGAFAPLRGRVLVESGPGASALAFAPSQGGIWHQALAGQPGVAIRIPGTDLLVLSGPDGTFRIERAPVGTFLVNAAAPGLLGTQEIVPIRRETDNQLVLTLLRTLGG